MVQVGLLVRLNARPGKEEELERFVTSALPLAQGEPATVAWFAIRLGPSLGARQLGATVYELPPGQSICPYHYEYPNEEWLVVLSGRVRAIDRWRFAVLGVSDFVHKPIDFRQLVNRIEAIARRHEAGSRTIPASARS